MNVRNGLKGAVERFVVASGAASARRRRLRGRALVLAYHNIVPDGEPRVGDASLHLPQRAFAAQLDLLLSTHDVVPLDQVCTPGMVGERPRVAITFDDAYRGALTAGLDEIQLRGLPATIFVAPAFVTDEGRSFWWDDIAWPSGTAEGERFRQEVLGAGAGLYERAHEIAKAHGYGTRPLPMHARCVSELELLHVSATPGIALGSHTWSHANLLALRDSDLRTELAQPLEWLRARAPRATTAWISYPYGCTSDRVAAAARDSGYASGVRIEGGWVPRGSLSARELLLTPRMDVPSGLSHDGFAMLTAGLRS